MNETLVLSARQIAKQFGVPLEWVRGQAKAGNLPHLKAGRRLLFNPSAVAEALARMARGYPQQQEAATNV
jgi:excisionase family DNA binding protein